MAESMREAVEGFEWERRSALTPLEWKVFAESGYDAAKMDAAISRFALSNRHYIAALLLHDQPFGFRRTDVLDLQTAANDARQLAIASPKLAEQALQQATRLSDLAERIGMLLKEAV